MLEVSDGTDISHFHTIQQQPNMATHALLSQRRRHRTHPYDNGGPDPANNIFRSQKNQQRMASSAALWYRLSGRYSWLRQRLFTAGSRVRTPYQLCTVALRSSFCNSQAPLVPYDLCTRRSAQSKVRNFPDWLALSDMTYLKHRRYWSKFPPFSFFMLRACGQSSETYSAEARHTSPHQDDLIAHLEVAFMGGSNEVLTVKSQT